MTTATHLFSPSEIDPATLPDGTYRGNWTGQSLWFSIGSMEYKARTASAGTQILGAACDVTIQGGEITVELLKP